MAARVADQLAEKTARLLSRLSGIRSKLLVHSGKGGVGKSFVCAGLAQALARRGLAVGVLDCDVSSPSSPRMLGAPFLGEETADGVRPALGLCGVRVASVGQLRRPAEPVDWKAPDGSTRAVWRGALEMSVVRELLTDIVWGELDVLLCDLPPGTGDKESVLAGLIPDLAGAIVVSTPSEVAWESVVRSVRSARWAGIVVLGLVVNRVPDGCPRCGARLGLPSGRTPEDRAAEAGLPLLGVIPDDPGAAAAMDAGEPLSPECPAAVALESLAEHVATMLRWQREGFAAGGLF